MRNLLLVITIIGWATFGFVNKIVLQRLHPLQIIIIGSIVNIILLPIYIFFSKKLDCNYPNVNIWSILSATAYLVSTIGTIAYIYGIRTGELSTVAVLSCSYPAITAMLSIFFLGEQITFAKIIGIMLVMIGIVVLGH